MSEERDTSDKMSYIEGTMIKSLQKMLCTDPDDEDNTGATSSTRALGPGDIGKRRKWIDRNVTPWRTDVPKESAKVAEPPPMPAAPKSLEEFEELEAKPDRYLHHKRPEYRYIYRQAVGIEDVYYCLNNRNNSTASCEDIILEIDLAGDPTTVQQMQLDIAEQNIKLVTHMYHLNLPLVQTIDVHRSTAQYDVGKHKMRIKMRAVRELDICNF